MMIVSESTNHYPAMPTEITCIPYERQKIYLDEKENPQQEQQEYPIIPNRLSLRSSLMSSFLLSSSQNKPLKHSIQQQELFGSLSKNVRRCSIIPDKKNHEINTLKRRSCLKGSRAAALAEPKAIQRCSQVRHVRFCQQTSNLRSYVASSSSSSCGINRNRIYMIESFFEYSDDIYWSKSELHEFRMTNKTSPYDNHNVDICLHLHQKLRQQFREVCSTKRNDDKKMEGDSSSTTTSTTGSSLTDKQQQASFQSMSKESYKQLVTHMRRYDVLGLDRYRGEDAKQRHAHMTAYVKRVTEQYQILLLKENNNMDVISQKLHKYSEMNTAQDRYWARYMGSIIHQSIKNTIS